MASNRPRVRITHDEMVDMLSRIDHATPVAIVTETVPKMRKGYDAVTKQSSNRYYDRITKITEASVFANCDWENSVNNELGREGKERDFVAGERAIDMDRRRINGKNTPILDKVLKGGEHRIYFEVHFYGHLKCETRYVLDGRSPIQKAEFEEYLPVVNIREEEVRQGVDHGRARIIRTYGSLTIREVHCNGVDYIII